MNLRLFSKQKTNKTQSESQSVVLNLTCSVEMSHTITVPSTLQEYATF